VTAVENLLYRSRPWLKQEVTTTGPQGAVRRRPKINPANVQSPSILHEEARNSTRICRAGRHHDGKGHQRQKLTTEHRAIPCSPKQR
jgi:hypothetical protein